MSKATKVPSAAKQHDPKILQLVQNPEETMAQTVGRIASDPAVNAGSVMQSFGNHLGDEVSLMSMIDVIQSTTQRVKDGDLSDLEAMLVSQATALQTIFTNLARRAQAQQYQRNLEAFLGLALKAQAQSRATISALVDLKYPRTTVIAKQANVANGPQQVNNGLPTAANTGTKSSTVGTDPHLEAVGKGDWADKPRRKSQGLP
ncbi:hypothetical protein [Variovorax sp. RA8]|uniref:hypothetical protein n=1 Tax=Variovorax sp. (strain JCM 16519 / RA8) TaxID=662548 RepID=UPI001318EA55|nr:hypothetical protein [Variovorax sp. RA8]VTU35474.1 hypothetical protein RA8CHR_05227 [Variovorax sp. RA8]